MDGLDKDELSGPIPPPVPAMEVEPPEEPQDAASPAESHLSEPPSIFETLGAAYAQKTEDRREVFPILPGRFGGNLAMRAKPVDPDARKKKVRRLGKRGITNASELQYAAEVIAEACDAILVRMGDSEDYIEAQTVPDSGLGLDPVRFDARLGQVVPPLGKILTGGESEATMVRLLFNNPEALDSFYIELDQWLREASPSSDDDEDEATERPT